MKKNYTLSHRLLAYILLMALFLQSCRNFSNQVISTIEVEESTDETSGSTKQIDIKPLVDKELTAEGSNLVTFYDQDGRLRADVRVDEKQPEPNYKNLPVKIKKGTNLAEIAHSIPQIQQLRIQLGRNDSGQPQHVCILKGGLSGGMKRSIIKKGDEDQEKEKEEEKEKETKKEFRDQEQSADNDLDYRKELLEHARKGEDKAQFELGEWAYNAWREQDPEGDTDETLHWLIQAKLQDYLPAINLLQEIEKKHPELVAKINAKIAEQEKTQQKKKEKEEENAKGKSTDKIVEKTLSTEELEAIKKYQKAAEQGDAEAQFKLGICYEYGQGVNQNYQEAAKCYQEATQQGKIIAQARLARMYYNGLGVKKDTLQANRLIQQISKEIKIGAELGERDYQFILGWMYKQGLGVNQDYREAIKWYKKAAKQDSPYAQTNLGNMCCEGQGVDKDEQKAIKWYKKAAKQNFTAAQYNLGGMYYYGQGVDKNEQKSIKWYKKAAKQGNTEAQNTLAVMYYNGQGVDKNEQKAIKWYKKAAKQGNSNAQYNLGDVYYYGRGADKNDQKAVKWYKQSAKQENLTAQNGLGVMYYNGQGVEKNYQKAIKWFKKAASKGNPNAQYNLGRIYERGEGTKKDEEKAAEWYIKAIKQSYTFAGDKLGKLTLHGIEFTQEWVTEKREKEAGFYIKASNLEYWKAPDALNKLALKGINNAQVWIIKQAEEGYVEAQYILDQMYEQGIDIEKGKEKSAEFYIKVAKQSYTFAGPNIINLALQGVKCTEEWIMEELDKENTQAHHNSNQIATAYEEEIDKDTSTNEVANFYTKLVDLAHWKAPTVLKELALKGIRNAQKLVSRQAEEGYKEAQYTLGSMYEQGIGVAKDKEKAAELYIKAVNQNHAFAKYKLINLALQEVNLAQEWVKDEAKKGDTKAQFSLGLMYEQGIGAIQDEEKAAKLYIKAVKQGYWKAVKTLNRLALLKGVKLAQNWVIKQAEKGDKEAEYIIYQLGKAYEQGIGVIQDEQKAAELYIKVANQENWEAYNSLRRLALEGNKTSQNWIAEQAERGDNLAKYTLGQMYEQGYK